MIGCGIWGQEELDFLWMKNIENKKYCCELDFMWQKIKRKMRGRETEHNSQNQTLSLPSNTPNDKK